VQRVRRLNLPSVNQGWHEKTIGFFLKKTIGFFLKKTCFFGFFAEKCITSDSTQITPRQNSKVNKRDSENLLDYIHQCYI
jgi:hypothetical protein